MSEDSPIKKEEEKIRDKEKVLESEIRKEEASLKKEEKELTAVKSEISQLKEREEAEEKRKSITEIEVNVNFDIFGKFFSWMYWFLIEKRVLFYILLIIALYLGTYVRLSSLPALGGSPLIGNGFLGMGGSLNGLDPYFFYTQMINVINTGNVPAVNHMQYLPIGLVPRSQPLLISFFGAYVFRLLQPVFSGLTPMTWFMIYPAIVTILTTILLFFIILELFDDYYAASIGAFIFPAFATFLSRSTAGFSTKTAMGFLFIVLAVYFLIKILKSDRFKTKMMYGFMLALAMGFSIITSGYTKYLLVLVPLVFLGLILFGYYERKDLLPFLPFALWIPFEASFGDFSLSSLLSATYIPMLLAYLAVLFKVFVYDGNKRRLRIPLINEGASVIIYSTLVAVFLLLLTGLSHFLSLSKELVSEFANPLGIGSASVNVVSLTVAEFGQMTLAQRVCEYNFLSGVCGAADTIGINFLLFIIGSAVALYLLTKRFKNWYIFYLGALPFLALVFGGQYTPGAASYSFLVVFILLSLLPLGRIALDWNKGTFKRVLTLVILMTFFSMIFSAVFTFINQGTDFYKYGIVAIAIFLAIGFLFDKFEENKKAPLYLVLFLFLIITLALSNVENRLLQPTDFIAVILIPIVITLFVKEGISISKAFTKDDAWRSALVAALVLVAVVFVVVDLYASLSASYATASQSGSGLALWGPTMLWVKYHTPQNSSVISWWDYGYWIEAIANRTSVADGSNAYGYQSMIAKYFFTATSPYVYSTYLNFIHRPNYAVISGSEVEKFSAISTIALNYTQYTPMTEGQPAQNSINLGNKSYQYLAVFGGQSGGIAPLEANFSYGGTMWDAADNYLAEVLIPFNYSNVTKAFTEGGTYGIVYNTLSGSQTNPIPMEYSCNYGTGCTLVDSKGIPGGVMQLNASDSQTLRIGGPYNGSGYIPAQISMSQYGNTPSVLFIPQKALDSLFTKLYLLNESVPGFKLVFSDGLPVNSFLSVNNQVLTNVNVYEINYTQLSKYMLTGQCSVDPSAQNYCDNLSYLPSVFFSDVANYGLIRNSSIS